MPLPSLSDVFNLIGMIRDGIVAWFNYKAQQNQLDKEEKEQHEREWLWRKDEMRKAHEAGDFRRLKRLQLGLERMSDSRQTD